MLRKYTDQQLADTLPTVATMGELLIKLGLVPRGGNYENLWDRIARLNLDASHLRRLHRGPPVSEFADEEVAEAVRSSRSIAQVLAALGLRPGHHSRIWKRIQQQNLDTSHFVGQSWRRGSRKPVVPARPLEEVLVLGSRTRTSDLKLRLIREGLLNPRCAACQRDRWMGEEIPLELDHINGRRDDNRLHNLQLLCPNCHAQTPTYRGRNIGRAVS